jgi:hypothetical protein
LKTRDDDLSLSLKAVDIDNCATQLPENDLCDTIRWAFPSKVEQDESPLLPRASMMRPRDEIELGRTSIKMSLLRF